MTGGVSYAAILVSKLEFGEGEGDFLVSPNLVAALHCFSAPFSSPPPWLRARLKIELVLSSSANLVQVQASPGPHRLDKEGKDPSCAVHACRVLLLSTTVPSQVILLASDPNSCCLEFWNLQACFPSQAVTTPSHTAVPGLCREDRVPTQLPLSSLCSL